MLRVDAAVVGGSARDLQLVARQRDDGGIAAGDRDRRIQGEILALPALLQRLALKDHVHVGLGRAVHDRRFGGVHLDDHIVHAAAVQGA